MGLVLNFVILVAGFVGLIKGADIFVDGSSGLARRFKVPSLIIGLTIVALGTSLPELAVSTAAAVKGANEIAISNIVGSNVFNLLMVLGFTAIFHPIPVNKDVVKRDFPIVVVVTLLLLGMAGVPVIFKGELLKAAMSDKVGEITRLCGIIFLVMLIAYIVLLISDAKKHPVEEEENKKDLALWKCIVFVIFGAALIIAGGEAVVYSAQEIARTFGMTETLIGLTVVAMGTSLPELVTGLVAAAKGETDLAMGNVVGSNIFNILLIGGVSSAIHPIAVNAASVFDLIILGTITVLVFLLAVTKRRITRLEGIIMVLLYAAEVVFAALR